MRGLLAWLRPLVGLSADRIGGVAPAGLGDGSPGSEDRGEPPWNR
jgi:hypothetical protein